MVVCRCARRFVSRFENRFLTPPLPPHFTIYVPIPLSHRSSNAFGQIVTGDYHYAIINSLLYVALTFFSKAFKECQSLIYLRVKQAAFVQLSRSTFEHLHRLSLDWHLRKKLGDVLRSMDRGINGCDTLMNYGFLYLLPALAECVTVCLVFALHFGYWPLSVTIFYFIFVYIVVTILMTLWRKKFRKSLNKNDNDYHDKITDSLVNFETVKVREKEREREREKGEPLYIARFVLRAANTFCLPFVLAISLVLEYRRHSTSPRRRGRRGGSETRSPSTRSRALTFRRA